LERRVNLMVENNQVRLLLVKDIGIKICGGAIGASGLQACVDNVVPGTKSCAVKSHVVKTKNLLE